MNILLIKPPTEKKQMPGDDLFMTEPLALEYVAAGVADRYDVRIMDSRFDKSLEQQLAEYAPAVVGLTSYTTQVYITRDICKKIKAFDPGILTVVGGHHATMAPADFCDPNIDIVVLGEGVFTFREIVERFEKKQDMTDVAGAAFYSGNGLKFTPPRDYPDLDSFPLPDRTLTERHRERYFLQTADGILKPVASLRTSKGCPFRCKFCALWKVTGGKYLIRDADSIIEELKTIKEPYIDLADDETFVDLKRMDRLADLIIDSGIKKNFGSSVRADTVVNNPGLFEKWRRAGLERTLIGLESNRPRDLEYFRKKSTIDTNEKAISILRKIGVKTDASFIILPDYDVEDFDNLADYAKSLEVDFAMFPPLTPLPGTDLYSELKDQLTSNNLELYDFSHMVLPTKLPLDRFYKELAYLYLKVNRSYLKPDKSAPAKFNRLDTQDFMKFYKELRSRHLHHQAR